MDEELKAVADPEGAAGKRVYKVKKEFQAQFNPFYYYYNTEHASKVGLILCSFELFRCMSLFVFPGLVSATRAEEEGQGSPPLPPAAAAKAVSHFQGSPCNSLYAAGRQGHHVHARKVH